MLWLLMTFLYVQTGFQLGKKAAKTWKKGDSKSLESFLLFPVSHARGKVGKDRLPFTAGIGSSAEATFRTLVTLGWPVMAAWNALLVLGLLGPDKVIHRLTAGPPTFKERIKAIRAEERKVDRVIRQLEAGDDEPKRPRRKKAKALAAPPQEAPAPPATAAAPAFPFDLAEPDAPRAEPSPQPVQVRVTVDVTAPGPAAEEADRTDEQDRAAAPPKTHAVVH